MEKKVILVTGASSGIGQSCADQLQRSGWTVVGASRRGTSSGSWEGVVMDVDSLESVNQGVENIMRRHGRIDAVLACAGWGLAGPAERTPLPDAMAQMDTNFWGAVRVVNATLPAMRSRGRGRIVLISSIGGVISIPFQSFYSASKFAMEGYGEALAYEVAPFKIHVTMVELGNFKTDFTARRRTIAHRDDDPYAAASAKAIETMERDELNGADPNDAAKAVERVLGRRRPPRRVSVGRSVERFGLVAKRFLPFRVFEASAKGSLGV